ncbi:DUF4232 domain-containing protein [Amycolatopsis sp. NBC_00355]|uniref:DUF4232 domain-containing protein n=1 Tax=Amycolatopsis sp. NBC_00355 TaxID=2975957 RepID=UPI002E2548DA
MKRILMGIGAAAGMVALTACGAAGAATQPSAGSAGTAGTAGGAGAAAARVPATSTPRCTTADLAVSLGKPAGKSDAPGQFDVPLTYRNTSDHTCGLYGVPGVDLAGPDDATFGPVYHLPRENNGVKYNEVPAGTTASATITVLTPSEGGASWTPTQLKTIPPGQTQALTADWPADLPVLRQDAATHPGTYVNGILADPA